MFDHFGCWKRPENRLQFLNGWVFRPQDALWGCQIRLAWAVTRCPKTRWSAFSLLFDGHVLPWYKVPGRSACSGGRSLSMLFPIFRPNWSNRPIVDFIRPLFFGWPKENVAATVFWLAKGKMPQPLFFGWPKGNASATVFWLTKGKCLGHCRRKCLSHRFLVDQRKMSRPLFFGWPKENASATVFWLTKGKCLGHCFGWPKENASATVFRLTKGKCLSYCFLVDQRKMPQPLLFGWPKVDKQLVLPRKVLSHRASHIRGEVEQCASCAWSSDFTVLW